MAKKKPGTPLVPGVAGVGDPQEDRLLRSVIEAPKEDAPRLAYAAWLQEQGDSRGAFIRAQVLARATKTAPAEKRKLRQQARDLLDAHWDSWAAPFIARAGTLSERGFFTRLRWDDSRPLLDERLARLAASPLFALLPLHHKGQSGPVFSIMARLPRLGCFKSLRWSGMAEDDEDEDSEEAPAGRVLMGSPHLAGLEELRLANCGLRDAALAALARNPAAASLQILDLGGDGSQDVAGNQFGTAGVAELAASPFLGRLQALDISATPGVGDRGVLALAQATATLPSLTDLNIDGTDLSDAGALALARCPGLARIERLRIGPWIYQDAPLGDPACRALLASPYLDNIKKLVILLGMEPETARALRKRFGRRAVLGP